MQVEFRYGDLVTSDAHIPEARGPYLFLHAIERYAVCIALDDSHSINIPIEKAKRFRVSAIALRVALARLEGT
jgi:hypothetical protein